MRDRLDRRLSTLTVVWPGGPWRPLSDLDVARIALAAFPDPQRRLALRASFAWRYGAQLARSRLN